VIEQERDVASGPGNRWNERSASTESKEKAARDSIIDVHENRHQSLTRFEQMDQIVQSTHSILLNRKTRASQSTGSYRGNG
jgi:hypothetical protein